MSNIELLPCPFCGHSTPEFERLGTGKQSCIVACGNCGCRNESGDEWDDCGKSWNTRAMVTDQASVEVWRSQNASNRAMDKSTAQPKYWSASVSDVANAVDREMALRDEVARLRQPIDMELYCPNCGIQHIDAPEDEREEQIHEGPDVVDAVIVGWDNPPHRSHLCHGCGTIWRPADVPTNGVAEIKTSGKADTWPVNAEEIAAQPAKLRQGEPVAWRYKGAGWERWIYCTDPPRNPQHEYIVEPLYASPPPAQPPQNPWRDAIDEALVVAHLGVATEPYDDLNRLLEWHHDVWLDPAVSSDAQALIDRGAAEERQRTAQPAQAEFHNPWRTSLENCISGDNYLRASEYRDLIEELDELYRLRAAQPPREPVQPLSDTVSVCKTDANNYCRILTALGMEEEGDPVAEVERLITERMSAGGKT